MFQRLFQKSSKWSYDMTQVIENIGGEYRNRTGVHGFAIRCVTTPPRRLALDSMEKFGLGVNIKVRISQSSSHFHVSFSFCSIRWNRENGSGLGSTHKWYMLALSTISPFGG